LHARASPIVELFANQRPGSVEGETFLADVVTTTDDGGHAKFSAVVDGSVPGGMPSTFTATTTSSDGATSELSQPVARPR
jgi:3-dehydroshikimate dehydratase